MHVKSVLAWVMSLLLWASGPVDAKPLSPDRIQEVAEEIPLLSPDLVWERGLPGRRRSEPFQPNAKVDEELSSAIQRLSIGWPRTGYRTDWTGLPGLVTHLSPPGEAPRAVFWFSDGHLYLVEPRQADWHSRRLTEMPAEYTSVIDLSGDGQPEIVTASLLGSGAHLNVQVFEWDRHRVWAAFAHKSAKEPGQFGWFDADGDGTRDLWIDTSEARGLFPGTTHGPFFRDRMVYQWEEGTYKQVGHYRFATPYYHLNRYLYYASKGDWHAASKHSEPGAELDRRLAAELGLGPFSGGSDHPFVNGRMYFSKNDREYYADFGPTGRLIRLGEGMSGGEGL